MESQPKQQIINTFFPVAGNKRVEQQEEPESKKRKVWPEWVIAAGIGAALKCRSFKKIIPFEVPEEFSGKRGKIRVLKIHNRFAKVDPELKKWPTIPNYERFNVCKNNKYQELSPMTLGPVHDENDELYGLNIEDAWQCSKVFKSQVDFSTIESLDWFPNWREWSRRGRFSNQAKRHRKANNSDTTLFSYYMGERLSYVEARKKMYCKWYARLVVQTNAFKDLKARHMAGKNLLLLEYDGLDRNNPLDNIDLDEVSLRKFIEDPSRPFGHALVLACVLLEITLW